MLPQLYVLSWLLLNSEGALLFSKLALARLKIKSNFYLLHLIQYENHLLR